MSQRASNGNFQSTDCLDSVSVHERHELKGVAGVSFFFCSAARLDFHACFFSPRLLFFCYGSLHCTAHMTLSKRGLWAVEMIPLRIMDRLG